MDVFVPINIGSLTSHHRLVVVGMIIYTSRHQTGTHRRFPTAMVYTSLNYVPPDPGGGRGEKHFGFSSFVSYSVCFVFLRLSVLLNLFNLENFCLVWIEKFV